MTRVRDGVFELVGETPMVRLRHVAEPGGAEVWAKLEAKNPSGSVKDRPALAMILLIGFVLVRSRLWTMRTVE